MTHTDLLLRRLVGAALRRARLHQGRTLRDVAREARVSMPYLSELERGLKEPSSEVLAAICRALGLRLSDLLAEIVRELARLEPAVRPRAVRDLPRASLRSGHRLTCTRRNRPATVLSPAG